MNQTKICAAYQLLGHLQHRKIKLHGQLTLELVEKGIAASGIGLDHGVGERVLAIGDDSIRDELDRFFMLTDQRLAGRRGSHFFHVPLTEIKQVQMSRGLVSAELKIHANSTTIDASLAPFIKPLGAYIAALCQVHPLQRTPPGLLLPEPNAQELASNEWLNTNASHLHPDCTPMLAGISRSYTTGELNHGSAVDLIQRIFLLSRTLQFGRGMQNLWWLSPISTEEIIEVFVALFDQPVASYQQAQLRIFDFQLGSSGGATGAAKAAASTAVGLASLGLLGIGWVSMPRRSVKSLRLTVLNSSGPAHFTLQGFDGSTFQLLSVLTPSTLRTLFQILARCEKQVLMSHLLQLCERRRGGSF